MPTHVSCRVCDLTTGELKASLVGHTDMVLSVAMHAKAKILVSGSEDNTIRWVGLSACTLTRRRQQLPQMQCWPKGVNALPPFDLWVEVVVCAYAFNTSSPATTAKLMGHHRQCVERLC